MNPATARRAIEAAFGANIPFAARSTSHVQSAAAIGTPAGAIRGTAGDDGAIAGARRLTLAVITAVAVAVVWAALAHVDTIVRGSGRVVAPLGVQQIGHPEGGTVAAILVSPGDRVVRGQPLIALEPAAVAAEAARADTVHDAKAARVVRLRAEAGAERLRFDPALAAAAPDLVAAETATFVADSDFERATLSAARARFEEAERTLAQARAQQRSREEARALAVHEWRMEAGLVDKGIEPEVALDRARAAARGAIAESDGAIASAERADAQISEARADLRAVGRRFREEASVALAAALAERALTREDAVVARDRAQRTVLRAPMDGVVGRVFARTVGGVARPGETLLEIVPGGGALCIEARFSARDVAALRTGARARMRIGAYDAAIFGSLDGRVVSVAPDTSRPEDPREGAPSYLVEVRAIGVLRDAAGRPVRLRPGMTAEVDAIGRSSSVLNYLLTPFSRLRRSAMTER